MVCHNVSQRIIMGNTISMMALAPFLKSYRELGFRNTDSEFPGREYCPTKHYKPLQLSNVDEESVRVPVYVCNVEGGPPTLHASGEGRFDIIRFFVGEQEHEMDVIQRDIGLEHESAILGCKVCSALGLSSELGLIYIYSVVPIPLPDACASTSSTRSQEGECSICYESDKDLVSTRCGHLFHDVCLRRWTVINPTCPYCRHDV